MRTTSVALELLLLLLPAPTLGSEGEVQRVLLAGDIASCDWTADTVTGHLGAARDGVVMTVGDPVYQLGTTSQFQDCYEPT